MKKKQKRILIFSSVFVLFILILFGATHILEKKIEEKLETGLRNLFQPELDGFDMQLSFINHFPHPSICIHDLSFSAELEDTLRHVLKIEKIDFQLDIGELFKNNYVFKDAILENAVIKFFTNHKGENLRVFRYRTDEERLKNEPITVSLSSIILKDFHIIAENNFKQTAWSITVDTADLEGNFDNRLLSIKGDVTGNFDSLIIKKSRFIKDKPIRLVTDFEYNGNNRTSTFNNSLLTFINADFIANGWIKPDYPRGSILNLTLGGKDDFGTLMGLLPPNLSEKFEQNNSNSTTKTTFNFTGLSGPTDNAKVEVFIDVNDAALVAKDYPAKFDQLDFSIKYTNGESRSALTSSLSLNKFEGLMNEKPIKISGDIFNLLNPSVDLDFDINMDLSDFSQFFTIKGIRELGGELALKGSYRKTSPEADSQIKIDGKIDLEKDDIKLEAEGFDFTDLRGEILIKDSILTIKKIAGIFSDIPFTMRGEAKNIYRLFLKNTKKLTANMDIYADFANLNTILNTVIKDKNKVVKGTHPLEFPAYLHGDLSIQTPRLFYKNITAKNVKSRVLFRGKELYVPQFEMDVLSGHLAVDAKLNPEKKGNYSVNATMKASNLNTNELLVLYENFNQSVLTSKNIKGRLSGTVEMQGILDKQLDYLENEISYHADFALKKGELIDFEPITKAFNNVRKRARAHILIDHAEGTIFYDKGKMIVPDLYFTSNMSALRLFGSREPTEEMDFYFNFSLADLLFGNAQKKKKRKKNRKSNKPGNTHLQVGGKPGYLSVKPIRKVTWDRVQKTTKRHYSTGKRMAFE